MTSPAPPPPPAAPKKSNALVWILLGLAGLCVMAGAAVIAVGWFAYSKVKEAGVDSALMTSNPALAITKLATAVNPEIDVVSVDEKNSRITLKEKATGKVVTFGFDDIQAGRISFSGEGGEQGSMTIGGAAKLPDWLPAYPGATSAMSFESRDRQGAGAMLIWSSKDAPDKVLKFYEEALKKAGIEASANLTFNNAATTGGVVGGESPGGRSASVIVGSSGGETSIQITFMEKRTGPGGGVR